MSLSEADTRAKLIDPALHARGWTEDLIRREETAGAIEVIEGKPRKQAKGRVDYTLRVRVNPNPQSLAMALIEAKAADLPPYPWPGTGQALLLLPAPQRPVRLCQQRPLVRGI